MALHAYLRLKGQQQGEIKGSVTQKGREGMILVSGASHSIESPRDAASGLPTGGRVHEPFIITKELDAATPLLYNMLVHNENILTWELQFWQPSAAGTERNHYTVKLTDASIASIDFRMPDTQDPHLATRAEYEEIAFTYQKIQWLWNEGGITSSDDWAAE
ncbi:MAG TPA: type VI secretion system tube protein TssD [Anaerolineales bacterium]|nr:type VI secretion system tube protein TssD [Anaerolineales bacterium]